SVISLRMLQVVLSKLLRFLVLTQRVVLRLRLATGS
ncbi:hypothetical protein Csa_023947, partial [Cucumis sativus]